MRVEVDIGKNEKKLSSALRQDPIDLRTIAGMPLEGDSGASTTGRTLGTGTATGNTPGEGVEGHSAGHAVLISYERPTLASYQESSFFNDYRYCWIIGSTKSGKSHAAAVWLIEQALLADSPKGKHYWWTAPSYAQSRIMYERLKNALGSDTYSSNESLQSITLFNGSVLEFKSTDNPDLLYGQDVWGVVCDEASRMREESFFAIRSTITATNGKIRLVGNVRGKDNFFWKGAQLAKQGKPNHAYFEMNCQDAILAGLISQEEVDDAKSSLPIDVFRELYLNIPSDTGSNPFGLKAIEEATKEGLSQLPPVVWGWDLAKSQDWTVGIGLDQHGAVAAFHRFQLSWEVTIHKIIEITGSTPALIDTTGVGDPVFESLSKGRPNYKSFKFSMPSKQQLMEGLALGIQSGQLRFPNNQIRTELEAFEYEYTRNGVKYSCPSGMNDDCVAALGLAWKLYNQRNPTDLWFLYDQAA